MDQSALLPRGGGPHKELSLFHLLRASYGREKLKRFGYRLDDTLSNEHNKVWFNPAAGEGKKLIVTVAGTNPTHLADLATDMYLAAGHLRDTDRFKSAKETLQLAKQRYGETRATVAGHSLGGSIAQMAGSRGDHIYSLDAGYTVGQHTKGSAYRVSGDVVSILGAANRGETTLANPYTQTGVLPVDALRAHNVDAIRRAHIIV